MNKPATSSSETVVCGIAASAGGLAALQRLLSLLSPQANVTYIIAQHLSPAHHSHLVQILSTHSKIPVEDAKNGQAIAGGKVYVAPPNTNIEVEEDKIVLTEPDEGPGPKPSASMLFNSLASSYQERAIAIVVSGTGSDGAQGIRNIRLAGGITIVQAPDDAQYDGMPRAAIDTRCVDMILPIEKMADALRQILLKPTQLNQEMENVSSQDTSTLEQITTAVRKNTDIDIAYYKESTLKRRIQRRMAIKGLSHVSKYAEIVRGDKEESLELAKSILISVTAFFRDPEVFEELKRLMTQLMRSMTRDETLRIWVPACATGEEAYSIAILYREIVADLANHPSLVIFASDMDEQAVDFARRGIYGLDSLTNISPDLLEKYFTKTGNSWQVRKSIRQQVVFSIQNLAEDPPFSRMHLVSCRNLLIYLRPNIQKQVFQTLHYALNTGGYLMLGQSESAEMFNDLFKVHSKASRIYRKSNNAQPYKVSFLDDTETLRENSRQQPRTTARDARRYTLQELANQIVQQSQNITWAVVDDHDVVKCLSRNAAPLFTLPEGPTILRVYNLVPDALQPEIRGLLYRCRKESRETTGTPCKIKVKGEEKVYRICITPFNDNFEKLWVVALLEEKDIPVIGDDGDIPDNSQQYIRDMEQRMLFLQQDLQSATEELETSNEELQSQSEELQSSNEELQSINEQLLTSNEELQSSNEELLTMNDEIRLKSDQLENVANAMHTLIETSPSPIIFCDAQHRITNANKVAKEVAEIQNSLINMPVQNVAWRFEAQAFIQMVRQTQRSGGTNQLQIKTDQQSWEVVMTACTQDDAQIDGVMLRFLPMQENDNAV